ncbi:MAG TPA: hypothetical protein VMI32_11700 [Candidatus Solibacter sp.]|nr:hypothetical protein [Candidatus Solibacter sp.]
MLFRKQKIFLMILLAGAPFGAIDSASHLPFGNWRRASENPIISPRGTGWESAGTFNPTVVSFESPPLLLHLRKVVPRKFVMLYRAQDAKGTSRIGYAESMDSLPKAKLQRAGHP